MAGAAERRALRVLLSAVVILGSVGAAYLALNGEIRPLSGVVICLLGIPAARFLPRGTRASAWLFAVWVGLSLAFVAHAPLVNTLVAGDRRRLAIAGGACYLVLAALGFWSCTGDAARSDGDS